MNIKLEKSWKNILSDEFSKEYFQKLTTFVKSQYTQKTIFPHPKNIFRAFNQCPFDMVRVIIIGQDPYHGDGQAHGLCFSVPKNIKAPPSLVNIYKEIAQDIGIEMPTSGNLNSWSKQGILLLNATLTVEAHIAGSHQNKGWEKFTDSAIKLLSNKRDNLVFLLWGAYAHKKSDLIDEKKHLILKAPHPSPLSAHRGFLGCRHFSKTNKFLASKNLGEINWDIN